MKFFIELLKYEFMKIWQNKKFLMFIIGMFILNIGLLWYSNLENDYAIGLSSYKRLEENLQGLNDEEKLKKAQEYYDNLIGDDDLQFTSSYEKETLLLEEVIENIESIVYYDEFLDTIENQGNNLSDVSIFSSSQGNKYSLNNIEETIEDYNKLQQLKPIYQSGKWVQVAMEFHITDIFIVLIICVVIYISIFYEKEKNLYSVIRVSKYGGHHIALTKIMALHLSCILITVIFYGGDFIYTLLNLTTPNLGYAIQGISEFSTSVLRVSVGAYLLIYLIAKTIVFIFIGNIIMAIAIISTYIFIPYISIGLIGIVSFIMVKVIIPTSKWAIFKYFNLVGLLDINMVFGEYLNINILNNPVNIHNLWLIFVIASLLISNVVIVMGYCKIKKIGVKSINLNKRIFAPHSSLFKYEAYKILIMKKGIFIILLFIIANLYVYSNHEYYLSGGELKYKQYMENLEGSLTEEKEEFLLNEKEKFEKAERKLEEIHNLLENKEITMLQSRALKEEYDKVLSNYPIFQRVWCKYEFLKENKESEFVYDSTYKMLFNTNDSMFKITAILYFSVMIFTLSVVFPMEYSNSQYTILHPTLIGIKKIERVKLVISIILSIVMMSIFIGGRLSHIGKYFGFSNISAQANSVFGAEILGASIPIVILLLIVGIILLILSLAFMVIILLVSKLVKNSVYTIVVVSAVVCMGSFMVII